MRKYDRHYESNDEGSGAGRRQLLASTFLFRYNLSTKKKNNVEQVKLSFAFANNLISENFISRIIQGLLARIR